MAKQSITIELDDETLSSLTVLGKPIEVLAHLARSAADGVRSPGQQKRDQTDQSLKTERDRTDDAIAMERETIEEVAKGVVRIARQRADQVVQTARDAADLECLPQSRATEDAPHSERARADRLLKSERSTADAALENERIEQRRKPGDFLAAERDATNKDLTGERTQADSLIIDQREANEQMVRATIRAQELTVEADAAKERAEKGERELRTVAEFREMFIAILGHDLRNPLGSIVMAAGLLLQRGRLAAQDAETAARIIRSSQRMSRMITQLLDLTRARLGGGLPIEPKATDLRNVCQNIVEEFEATIQLEFEGDVTGTWDQDRLAEALSNLAGNAIEYGTAETPVIIKARAVEAEVVVEVINQGEPIPGDLLPFIFEPFRRARPREKSKAGNLGLGLYIAQQIVLAHGGTIDARSAEGTTSFVVRLPRSPSLRAERRKSLDG